MYVVQTCKHTDTPAEPGGAGVESLIRVDRNGQIACDGTILPPVFLALLAIPPRLILEVAHHLVAILWQRDVSMQEKKCHAMPYT